MFIIIYWLKESLKIPKKPKSNKQVAFKAPNNSEENRRLILSLVVHVFYHFIRHKYGK